MKQISEGRRQVRGHAEQHLEAVQDDGVSGLHRVFTCCFCSQQNLKIGVKYGDPDDEQEQRVGDVSLLGDDVLWERRVSETEHLRMNNGQMLCGQSDDQVRRGRDRGGRPHQQDQRQRSLDGPNLEMVKREADSAVALQGHAGQVQGRVLGGDHGQQQENPAHADVDPVDGVTDDEQHDGQVHLDQVIHHQVDEEYVAWVHVEHLPKKKKVCLFIHVCAAEDQICQVCPLVTEFTAETEGARREADPSEQT